MKKFKTFKSGTHEVLTRSQLKNILGGGSCCWHTTDWKISQCGLSMSDAQMLASGDLKWCCSSCSKSFSTSLTNPD
ncbi:transposase-like protein [Chryseobacterium sp. 2987]|nr:transposase-like protein [Chryseobacterium sp. 2987]